MMTLIEGVLFAAGSSLAGLIVVKVTVVAALGLAAAWLARSSRAAVRHAILAATCGAMLVLPIASIVAPPVHVTVPVAQVNQAARPPVVNSAAPLPPVAAATGALARVAPAVPHRSSKPPMSDVLLAGWIVGAAAFLMPVMTGLWQIRSLRRSGLPWLDGQSIAETLALDAGTHRRVEVLLHEALLGPITFGVLHPAILLPQDAENWAREDLSRAIVHELEHVRRGDSATGCLARAACALYWFHPLAWIAWRKLVLEAERSCDDAVLRRSEATAYADQLVELAKRLPIAQGAPLLAMANRSDLATRVRAVLDARQQRGRAGAFSLGLATTAAIVLVISMSSLTLVAMPRAAATLTQTVTPPQFDAGSVKPIDPTVQGEPPALEKPDALRLVAQAQPATVDRTVSSAPATLAFEVASVRASDGGQFVALKGGPGTQDPTRVSARGVTLPNFLMAAYDVAGDQISGPDSIHADRYDLQANIPTGTTNQQYRLMMQNLLAERFHLTLRHETKDFPVYTLVLAKGGPKLKGSAGDTKNPDHGTESSVTTDGVVRFTAVNESLPEFAAYLKLPLGFVDGHVMTAHIEDRTGLTGRYDFALEYDWVLASPNAPGAAPEAALPALQSALERQLGIKLERRKAPLDVLIVEHYDRVPTDN